VGRLRKRKSIKKIQCSLLLDYLKANLRQGTLAVNIKSSSMPWPLTASIHHTASQAKQATAAEKKSRH
jgi:hypothetical protein